MSEWGVPPRRAEPLEQEPLQPGWYPTDNPYWQRFFAGRHHGWTDSYMMEIWCRDPSVPPGPRRDPVGHVLNVVAVPVVVVLVVLAVSVQLASW